MLLSTVVHEASGLASGFTGCAACPACPACEDCGGKGALDFMDASKEATAGGGDSNSGTTAFTGGVGCALAWGEGKTGLVPDDTCVGLAFVDTCAGGLEVERASSSPSAENGLHLCCLISPSSHFMAVVAWCCTWAAARRASWAPALPACESRVAEGPKSMGTPLSLPAPSVVRGVAAPCRFATLVPAPAPVPVPVPVLSCG